jgi:hypothetical protein
MIMANNKWINNPWTLALIPVLFGSLLTIGYDIFKEKPFLTSLSKGFNIILDLTSKALNFNIKVWWLILIIVFILIILIYISKSTKDKQIKPEFTN